MNDEESKNAEEVEVILLFEQLDSISFTICAACAACASMFAVAEYQVDRAFFFYLFQLALFQLEIINPHWIVVAVNFGLLKAAVSVSGQYVEFRNRAFGLPLNSCIPKLCRTRWALCYADGFSPASDDSFR